jgi:ABC-2 type transport system ATP-binding protein
MSVAEKMCDFILMIFRGRKVLDGTLAVIKSQYGQDTIRIACEGGAAVLNGLEHVEKVTDYGRIQELRMVKGADPQAILAAIMKRTRIDSFEIATPSLHDIFVRIAGPEAEQNEPE